jgi:benzoylformate decarboxylase
MARMDKLGAFALTEPEHGSDSVALETGWGVPAAVGLALGDRDRGVTRPVIGLIGDGSS